MMIFYRVVLLFKLLSVRLQLFILRARLQPIPFSFDRFNISRYEDPLLPPDPLRDRLWILTTREADILQALRILS